jgi:membrane protein implicated in regulation of membrane protease activity
VRVAFRLRLIALILVAGVFLLLVYSPTNLLDAFHSLLALTSVALLFAAVGTLVWFFYWFFLRRLLRARRIANARLNRIMRERDGSDFGPPRE